MLNRTSILAIAAIATLGLAAASPSNAALGSPGLIDKKLGVSPSKIMTVQYELRRYWARRVTKPKGFDPSKWWTSKTPK